jgi:hypothetical protein
MIKCMVEQDPRAVLIELPEEKKRIGVMLSGGADSALLLYMIAKEQFLHNADHDIIPLTIARSDGAVLYSPGIVNYVNKFFGMNIPQPVQIGKPDLPHKDVVRLGVVAAFAKHKLDYVYLGETQLPPDPVLGVYPVRSQQSPHQQVILPFVGLYKTHVIDMYYTLRQEELLKLTHSCTERTIWRCDECFNCSERAWAFNKLNRTDPGSN